MFSASRLKVSAGKLQALIEYQENHKVET